MAKNGGGNNGSEKSIEKTLRLPKSLKTPTVTADW